MAHPSSYQPNSGIERWLDARLPIVRVIHDQILVFPTPRNLNYWWTFGGILTFMLVAQIVTGVPLAMHYVPTEEGAFDSVEKIMRDVNWGWLLRYVPRRRRLDVLPRRLHPHFPRPLLRLLQGAARGVVDPRRAYPHADDRHRLHGILAAMGADELLGRHRDHQSLLVARRGDPGARHHARRVDLGRVCGRRADIEATLRAALSVSVSHRRRRRPPYLGIARSRQQQPNRHRREIAERNGAVPSLLHDQGRPRAGRLHPRIRGRGVLCAEFSRPSRQLRTGQSAADPAAYRAGMVFPALLRDLARHPEQAVGRRRAEWLDPHSVLRALARHVEGAIDQLPAGLQMVLLGFRADVRRARLSRRSGSRGTGISCSGASSPSTTSPSSSS